MTLAGPLRFRAGPEAFRVIRRDGFDPQQIGTIAGASGGAKWLVLSRLDRAIAARILPHLTQPVYLIGSSIGAWRFSCYAQLDPVAALERFEEAYLEQSYSDRPDVEEITLRSQEIIDTVLGETGVTEIMAHPLLRPNVMTVRARHVLASENNYILGSGLIAAATSNIVSRRTLGAFFRRALFYDDRARPPFLELPGMPMDQIELRRENYRDAVLASGAIPLVLRGVKDIAGAPRGIYRDGGIIDYHLDIPTSSADRITLYPHFFDHLIPGWFDKKLAWRRNAPANIRDTLLVCPSSEFVDALPNGKIPDRSDFQTMRPPERRKVWRRVVAACDALAEDFCEVLETGSLPARLETL